MDKQFWQRAVSELDVYELKVFMYLYAKSNDKNVAWNVKHEDIETDCGLGYTKVYQVLSSLREKGYADFQGRYKKATILI